MGRQGAAELLSSITIAEHLSAKRHSGLVRSDHSPGGGPHDCSGREKPALAAVPGTSNHGWGLAVDLCGGIDRYDTAAYDWMKANAGRFGFLHPEWAEPGHGREEPWHWEYAGT